MSDEYLTVPEIAERWHVKARSVREVINRKKLIAAKLGGQWLVKPADLKLYEESCQNVTRSPKRTRAPRKRAA